MRVFISIAVIIGFRAYAFSEDNPSEVQLPAGGTASNVNDDAKKRFIRYSGWNYTNLFPLAREAQKKGLSASKEEIVAQKNIIQRMYSVAQVADVLATNEILARKYALSVLNIKPTREDKEKAYKEITAGSSGVTFPSKEEMAGLIETRAIADCPVIKNELTRIFDHDEKMRVKSENEEEVWSLNDLQIHSGDDACIARHPDGGNCQLSVKKYNNLIRYQTFPKTFPLDTARRIAINNMLTDDYLAANARLKGFDRSETASEDMKGWLKWSAQNARMKKSGRMVTDENELYAVYGQYYGLLFSEKTTLYCSLIGSSDSLFIDSMAQLHVKATLERRSAETSAAGDTVHKPVLPWSRSSGDMLPDELRAAIDSLPCGSVSKPVRTSYGSFLVRLDSISIRPEIPFENARDKVVALATRKKWRNFEQAIADTAFRIYSSDQSLNTVKDTLSLAFLLQTNIGSEAVTGSHAAKQKSKKEIQAAFVRKGIKIYSTQLPFDILDSLMKRYEKSHKKRGDLGPIPSWYGTWYFNVLDVKAGNGKIPYSKVKKRLIDSLVACAVDSGECAAFENPDSLLKEVSLARVYAPRFFELDDASDDEKAEAAKKAGARDSGNPDWYYEAKVEEIVSWIDKMVIHIP